MSILKQSLLVMTILAILVAAGPSTAQIPDEFTNLKLLPKDISKRELMNIMRSFAMSLGERCSYCHVGKDPNDLATFDFASDDKEEKLAARVMMKMSGEINNTYLTQLGEEHATRVRCVTCHRGVAKPEQIDNVLMAVAGTDGVDAAMAKYRELREQYYGSAAYDFSAMPLNSAAERLAQERGDVAGAIAIMKMNIELNPGQAYSYLLLGQFYQASGDKAAAIASIEKSLELEPDNDWAKGLLQQMKASE